MSNHLYEQHLMNKIESVLTSRRNRNALRSANLKAVDVICCAVSPAQKKPCGL